MSVELRTCPLLEIVAQRDGDNATPIQSIVITCGGTRALCQQAMENGCLLSEPTTSLLLQTLALKPPFVCQDAEQPQIG
jgi:hypothetical protein